MKLDRKPFTLETFQGEDDNAGRLDINLDEMREAINDRVDSSVVHEVITPPTADTEFMILHDLGVEPTRFLMVSTDKAGHLYRSDQRWTDKSTFFKFSAALANVKVILW